MRVTGNSPRRGRWAAALLAAVSVGALLAGPAEAAVTPANPPLPAGFLDGAVTGVQTTSGTGARTAVLRIRGAIPGRPGNYHESLVQYANSGGGVSASVGFQERHAECAAGQTADCPIVAYLTGGGFNVPVTAGPGTQLRLRGTLTYYGAYGPGWGSRPLPGPAAVDVTSTLDGASIPPLTRANADEVKRTRTAGGDVVTWNRRTDGSGTASGRIGVSDGSAGNGVSYTLDESVTANGGQPLGQLNTAAKLQPFLPTRTAAGKLVASEPAAATAALRGRVNGALTTSTGYRVKGNSFEIFLSSEVRVDTAGNRTPGYSVVSTRAFSCALPVLPFAACRTEAEPTLEVATVQETVAADGRLVFSGTLTVREGETARGTLPFTMDARRAGNQSSRTSQTGARYRGPAGGGNETYTTLAEWDAATVSASVGGRTFGSVPNRQPTLRYERGL